MLPLDSMDILKIETLIRNYNDLNFHSPSPFFILLNFRILKIRNSCLFFISNFPFPSIVKICIWSSKCTTFQLNELKCCFPQVSTLNLEFRSSVFLNLENAWKHTVRHYCMLFIEILFRFFSFFTTTERMSHISSSICHGHLFSCLAGVGTASDDPAGKWSWAVTVPGWWIGRVVKCGSSPWWRCERLTIICGRNCSRIGTISTGVKLTLSGGSRSSARAVELRCPFRQTLMNMARCIISGQMDAPPRSGLTPEWRAWWLVRKDTPFIDCSMNCLIGSLFSLVVRACHRSIDWFWMISIACLLACLLASLIDWLIDSTKSKLINST